VTELAKALFLFLSALFPIVDPLGGAPIFLALTQGYSRETRRSLAWRIALDSFYLLMGSYLIGSHVLAFFGISLPVVQVSGGLVVVASGWTLLKQPDETERNDAMATVDTAEPLRRAFYPLTLPLTVGPGSISVAITLGANAAGRKGHWCPDHVERDQPAAVLSSGLRPLGRHFRCFRTRSQPARRRRCAPRCVRRSP